MRPRPLDILIILLAGLAVVLASLAVYAAPQGRLSAVISGKGGAEGKGGEWVYPLDEKRRIEIEGPLGTTVVEIDGEGVHVASSPCKNQTCVAAGHIDKAGQWVACLPNEVFVRIEGGGSDDQPDAGAY